MPHFDTFLCVFEVWALKMTLHYVLCSVSERIQSHQAHVLCHAFNNKNTYNQLNKSSASHFTKVSLYGFTDLHMKWAFYGGTKEHRWKEGGMGRNIRFISITVFS